MKIVFSGQISKITQISNLINIRSVRPQTDGQTDMAKLVVAFRTFANTARKLSAVRKDITL
jgi:hypothetical protein